MKPRVVISFAVIMMLLVIATVVLSGCNAKINKPFNCECECKDSKFECSGMSLETTK